VDEGLSAFEHVRWQGEIFDLAHTHSDEFVADDSSKEAFSPRDLKKPRVVEAPSVCGDRRLCGVQILKRSEYYGLHC
jgi:hypothetical protein